MSNTASLCSCGPDLHLRQLRLIRRFLNAMRKLLARIAGFLISCSPAYLESRKEVSIMYYGRCSEYLMITSEHFPLPDGACSLQQVLDHLQQRGKRWAYELDDAYVSCGIDGKAANKSDQVAAGVEIAICSIKTIFEP